MLKILLCSFFVTTICFAQNDKQYLDMHTHLVCKSPKNGCYVKDQRSKKYQAYLDAIPVTHDELIRYGDYLVADRLSKQVKESRFIKYAIAYALDGVYDANGKFDIKRTQSMFSNRYVYNATKRYKNLLFGASINPLKKGAIQELVKVHKQGAKLIKWIPCVQLFDPASKDNRIINFFKKLVELDMPLVSHVGHERSFSNSVDALCDPARLENALKIGVRVIAPHAASTGKSHGEKNSSRLLKLFAKYKNLYTDNSALMLLNRVNHLKYTFNNIMRGRVLYGSDYPLINVKIKNVLISNPYAYLLKIGHKNVNYVIRHRNGFDRDVLLKTMLGVPKSVFVNTNKFFKIKN